MGVLVLVVLLFASQVIGGLNTQVPPPLLNHNGNLITILSIDGGGIRGIIPATVLDCLQQALQKKDEDATLAKYFDVIAGTSTGGLMTAMLTTPNPDDNNKPYFTPAGIVDFYVKHGPSIFNQTSRWNRLSPRPKYDGVSLHNLTKSLLKDTRLNQTLTNVVIPTFDIKNEKPVIFSTFKIKTDQSLNANLSDIILGTSAAPTYLPPYYFKNYDSDTEFNLIDGGIAAGNPAMMAVSEVIQEQNQKDKTILLLSVGCGSVKNGEGPDAETAATFSAYKWASTGPLLFALANATKDMTDYYLATAFPGLQSSDNYLRIQEYNLDPSIAQLDDTTEANMANLQTAGQNLLDQTVLRMNVDTFEPEEYPTQGTNAQALRNLADILYNEKQLRLTKQAMEKGGRPSIETVKIPFGRTWAA